MKNLIESLLDDEQVQLDRLNIPNAPKVSKKEYVYYAQAWYDILESALDNNKNNNQHNWAELVKVYKEWLSDFDIIIPFEDFDEYKDKHGDFNWYRDIQNFLIKTPNQEKKFFIEYLDEIIDDFENGDGYSMITSTGSNSLLISFFGDDNIFRLLALYYRIYTDKDASYKKFYNLIKQRIKFCGITV